jgi:endonuclease YncB( thermonuclease family)
MFGWRRRNDGFEWREYVRTTILVRRKNRRDRVEQAGKAAVDGLKAAGERGAAAGAVGAQALGRGAKVAGQRGMELGAAAGRGAKAAGQRGAELGAAALRATDERVRAGIPVAGRAAGRGLRSAGRGLQVAGSYALVLLELLWTKLCVGVVRLARAVGPLLPIAGRRLEPMLALVREPSINMPLVIAGSVALLGGAARGMVGGIDRDTLLALLIGLVLLGVSLAARYPDGGPAWINAPLKGAAGQFSRLADLRYGVLQPLVRSLGLALVLVIVGGSGWLLWRGASKIFGGSGSTHQANSVNGRATALSGDSLRVGSTTIALAEIEAPLNGQMCSSGSARPWRCDAAAKAELARLTGSGRVACELSGTDANGRQAGSCKIGDRDIAAELVRGGHVFAETGLFSSYGTLEQEARAAKLGVWGGDAERPADYRAHKWQDAKRDAPDGCPIKGGVKRGQRIYVLPWSRDYASTRVSAGRGERWFCSESEAQAAGWKPSDRS